MGAGVGIFDFQSQTLAYAMSDPTEALQKSNGTGISGSIQIQSIDDLSRVSAMMAKSGFFDDAKSAHQAGVKIMAGMELGIPPVASVRGIDIIDGNTSLSSALVAALIKQHPHYDYKVVESTDERCEIAFYENGQKQGTASFSMEEANSVVAWTDSDGEHTLAEKDNWQNYPSDCLFARAISRGRRRFCPDVGLGRLYTAEEMNASGEPQVVDAEVVDDPENGEADRDTTDADEPAGEKPGPEEAAGEETVGNDYDDLPFEAPEDPPPQDVNRFHALGTELHDDWDEKRPELVEWVTDGRTDSSKDLDATELDKLIRGMEDKLGEEAEQMIG
jgi:hypothetical protein